MNIPSLPLGLSWRDLEPQDEDARRERELDEADMEIDIVRGEPKEETTEAEKQWEEWNLPAEEIDLERGDLW